MGTAENAPTAATHLDPVEIPVTYNPKLPRFPRRTPKNAETDWRHRGWWPLKRRVETALDAANVPDRRALAFAECGTDAWVSIDRDQPQTCRVRANCCKDRFCIPCQAARTRRLAQAVAERVRYRPCRLVTLTLAGPNERLADTIARLITAFRALRRRPIWKRTQRGGVAFIEFTRNKETGRWHPHLHVITEGGYLPVQNLRTAWTAVAPGSIGVDVRLLRNPIKAASYVTKYASKPLHPSVQRDPESLAEAVTACTNRRMWSTWGDWHKNPLVTKEPPRDWVALIPLAMLITHATQGNLECQRVLAYLRQKEPWSPSMAAAVNSLRRNAPGSSPSTSRSPPSVPQQADLWPLHVHGSWQALPSITPPGNSQPMSSAVPPIEPPSSLSTAATPPSTA